MVQPWKPTAGTPKIGALGRCMFLSFPKRGIFRFKMLGLRGVPPSIFKEIHRKCLLNSPKPPRVMGVHYLNSLQHFHKWICDICPCSTTEISQSNLRFTFKHAEESTPSSCGHQISINIPRVVVSVCLFFFRIETVPPGWMGWFPETFEVSLPSMLWKNMTLQKTSSQKKDLDLLVPKILGYDCFIPKVLCQG